MSEVKIDPQQIKSYVNEKINKMTVLQLEFNNITPWWGGDYQGYTSDCVDEDEIVGRLRWFLTTVYNRFCIGNKDSISEYLGSTSGVSKYLFKVTDCKPECNICYKSLERVSFITKGKKGNPNSYAPKDMRFRLQIIKRGTVNKDYIVAGGTLLTLAYIGIGRGANRGFGRFYPVNCNGMMSKDVRSICDKIIKGDIEGAFKEFYDKFKQLECKGQNSPASWKDSELPLAPRVADSKSQDPDVIKATQCTKEGIIDVINLIHCSTLKATFKVISYKIRIKDPGPFIHTWLFGFPRSVKRTGYFYRKGKRGELKQLRRQSMFILSPVKQSDKYTIYVLPFLSLKDHEEVLDNLIHIGYHNGSQHSINVKDLVNSNGSNPAGLNKNEHSYAKNNNNLSFGSGQLANLIINYTNELVNVINKLCVQQK